MENYLSRSMHPFPYHTPTPRPTPLEIPPKMDRESINTQTEVGLTIAKQLMLNNAKESNLVLSPLSIHVILSLIAAGSRGPTLDQLLSFLRAQTSGDLKALACQVVPLVFADGSPSGGPRLSFVNSVWVEESLPLKPSFKNVVENDYKATSNQVDFKTKAVEVANQVNSWANKETSGLIKEILPSGSVNSLTRLVLANALYFKGAWNQKFDASRTNYHYFYPLNGNPVQAPFMTSYKDQVISVFNGFKVLGLPYKQGEDKRRFSMYIFLPNAKDGLPALVEKLGSESGFLDRHIPKYKVGVGEFRIPKFKISFGFEASELLKGLGLVLPFSKGGLTEMVDSPSGSDLYVSSIFHKSFIEVNEEGTEAAAVVSAAVMTLPMCYIVGEKKKIDFVADHPFMFIIREDVTGVMLFTGQVLNPLVV